MTFSSLKQLSSAVAACRQCPRLVQWREKIASEKRRAFQDEAYWGKPVPGFGSQKARLLVCGLAPAAHGANRTGRMFTGDRSGDWLYAALHRAGFANQPNSTARDDGLQLQECYITACVRCAPPVNKPAVEERDACLPYLANELRLLKNVRVILCLGGYAWEGILRTLREIGHTWAKRPKFGHGAETVIGPYHVLGSYHPSQQNTFTGRLTMDMLDAVFTRARELLSDSNV